MSRLSLKRKTINKTKKKKNIPLFPFNWIFREIKYQHHIVFPKEAYDVDKSFKYLNKANIYEIEPTLKRFSSIGADPNYLLAILLFHIDPSKYFTFKTVIKNQFEKGKKSLKQIEGLMPNIEKISEPENVLVLKEAIKKIQNEIKTYDYENIKSYTLQIAKKTLEKKKGRPAKESINKIICLTYRHLKKNATTKVGTLGNYRRTADLLNAAYIKKGRGREFDKKDIYRIVKEYRQNKNMIEYCKSFEDSYGKIGNNLIKKAKKLGILAEFARGGVKK